jgi:small subunit ribosomal protein S1
MAPEEPTGDIPPPEPEARSQAASAPEESASVSQTGSDVPAGSSAAALEVAPKPGDEGDGQASDGDGGASDDGDGEASADGDDSPDGEATAASEGEAAPDGTRPKRKRKRRRKKKGVPAEGGADAASTTSPPGEGRDAQEGGGKPTRAARPPKKHRPPMERAPFHVGEEVFGKVTSVLEHAIMVDLSGKALAIFDRSEMEADDLVPGVGDRLVARVHQDGARGGLVVLTRKPLREEEAKPRVEQASKDGSLINGLVTGVIRGGVEVDIGGLRAFAPASGMDLHPHDANFVELLGSVLDFKVIQFDPAGRDFVVTRRPMLEAEAHARRKKALSLLTEGAVMKGVVRTVVEWGAFVALPEAENLEGLIHISEASHDPRARMTELFHPGQETEIKLVKIDERGKLWLSRRALVKDPWSEAREAFAEGSRHSGKVTRVESFGVFVELADGIDGLIHVSDLTLKRIEHPKEIVKEGDTLDVVVANFDNRNHKIALHPAPPPERADEAAQKVTRNSIVKVEVIRGEASGVVVRILGVTGRGARGFIPGGQTGTERGTDLRKKFPPGKRLDVKVVEIDPRRGEPKLSIRQAAEDEERRSHREYRQQLAKEGGFGTLGDILARKLGK